MTEVADELGVGMLVAFGAGVLSGGSLTARLSLYVAISVGVAAVGGSLVYEWYQISSQR
jgi:hypothetical protein